MVSPSISPKMMPCWCFASFQDCVRESQAPEYTKRSKDCLISLFWILRDAKSPFGVVDTVNDYQSLFKPALLCTKPGGKMLVTNNVASVEQDVWIESLKRCTQKIGRSIESIEMITPDADFPSLDAKPPLKMAWLTID